MSAPFSYQGAIVLEDTGRQGCRRLVSAETRNAIPPKPQPQSQKIYHPPPPELDPSLHLGCRAWVMTAGRSHAGTVRFIGYIATSERAEALWVGVVLDERVGRHSGQACDGRYYFRCQHGFGLYARPECVEPWYNNL
eukprot:TRINITY_DN1733_c0_g1_i6.p1 TRINITY_DN1733_c0_g1~~TRINITY_DN1733_c0_g1_i6.p1  ORF type:complete len:137 (-),score=7.71 TRINITY_DN1733_c0_g1_i6:162-572(-)